jgi:type I restriction enzyme M protein
MSAAMHVLTVNCEQANAPERFAQSMQQTGFGVLVNHPISLALVDEVYREWKQFFAHESAKQSLLFNRETQDGFFPQSVSETAKGAELKDIKDKEIVFLLFSAFKDGVFENGDYNDLDDINNFIITRLYNSNEYFEIFQVYESVIQLMSPKRLSELYQYMNRIDTQELEYCRLNFSEIFELLLDRYLNYDSKISGAIIQPKEVTKLVVGLANLNKYAKVYNPFAGLASYCIDLKKNKYYYGQELMESTWALGMLRLLAHNKSRNVYYSSSNSIENFEGNIIYNSADSIDFWPENKKFDLVVSTPPFKVRIKSLLKSQITGEPYRDIENYLIENGIKSLDEDGKLIAVFSLSFLFFNFEKLILFSM